MKLKIVLLSERTSHGAGRTTDGFQLHQATYLNNLKEMYRIDLNYGHNLFLLILHVIKIFDEMHVEYQNNLEIYTIYLHSLSFHY